MRLVRLPEEASRGHSSKGLFGASLSLIYIHPLFLSRLPFHFVVCAVLSLSPFPLLFFFLSRVCVVYIGLIKNDDALGGFLD